MQSGVTPLLELGCSLLSTHPVEYDTEGLSVFAWSLWYALIMIKKDALEASVALYVNASLIPYINTLSGPILPSFPVSS